MATLEAGQVSLCEEMLRNIPDVVSARVITSADGSVEAIQVLAGAQRSSSDVAGDVVAVLKKYFAVDITPDTVAVSHLQEPPESNALIPIEQRPRFLGLNVSTKGNKIEVKVEVASKGSVLSGTAVGPASTRNRRRLVAQAMLTALENQSQSGYSFILEDLAVVTLAGKQVVLVGVSLLSPLGENFLTGTAVVDEEEPEAIVKATLDAINRRLSVLTG
ncbi:MAG TPA: hypothetical protein EYP63_01710 [Desulfotomaculum sp.]|nr:hypothetical protein [Desulfotomaculum sp.]